MIVCTSIRHDVYFPTFVFNVSNLFFVLILHIMFYLGWLQETWILIGLEKLNSNIVPFCGKPFKNK